MLEKSMKNRGSLWGDHQATHSFLEYKIDDKQRSFFPKITAKEVTHGVIAMRQITYGNIELLILKKCVTVGDTWHPLIWYSGSTPSYNHGHRSLSLRSRSPDSI
jgi:hypothetical protein